MDTLRLRLVPPGDQAWEPDSPDLVILVNGRELIDVVKEIELPLARAEGSPGGQLGATLTSSAAGSHPSASTSDQPQPGLATNATPELLTAS